MLEPPESYDVWATVRWLFDHEDVLYVRMPDPELPSRKILVRLKDLPSDRWVYHAQRLHNDPNHQVWTKERWAQWDKNSRAQHPDI